MPRRKQTRRKALDHGILGQFGKEWAKKGLAGNKAVECSYRDDLEDVEGPLTLSVCMKPI